MNSFILAIMLGTTNPVIPPTTERYEFPNKQECYAKLKETVKTKGGLGLVEFSGKKWPIKLIYIACTEYKK